MRQQTTYITLGGTFNMVHNSNNELVEKYNLFERLLKRYILQNCININKNELAIKLDNIVKNKDFITESYKYEIVNLYNKIKKGHKLENYDLIKTNLLEHFNNPREILVNENTDLETDSLAFAKKELEAIYEAINSEINKAKKERYRTNIKFISGTDSAAIYVQYIMQRLEDDFKNKKALYEYCSLIFSSSMHPQDYKKDPFFNVKIENQLGNYNEGFVVAQVTKIINHAPIIKTFDANIPFIKINKNTNYFITFNQSLKEIAITKEKLGNFLNKQTPQSPLIIAEISSGDLRDFLITLIYILDYTINSKNDLVVIPVNSMIIESISSKNDKEFSSIKKNLELRLDKCLEKNKSIIFYQPYYYDKITNNNSNRGFLNFKTHFFNNRNNVFYADSIYGNSYEFMQASIATKLHSQTKNKNVITTSNDNELQALNIKQISYISFSPLTILDINDKKTQLKDLTQNLTKYNIEILLFQLSNAGLNKKLSDSCKINNYTRTPLTNYSKTSLENNIITTLLRNNIITIQEGNNSRDVYEAAYYPKETILTYNLSNKIIQQMLQKQKKINPNISNITSISNIKKCYLPRIH